MKFGRWCMEVTLVTSGCGIIRRLVGSYRTIVTRRQSWSSMSSFPFPIVYRYWYWTKFLRDKRLGLVKETERVQGLKSYMGVIYIQYHEYCCWKRMAREKEKMLYVQVGGHGILQLGWEMTISKTILLISPNQLRFLVQKYGKIITDGVGYLWSITVKVPICRHRP